MSLEIIILAAGKGSRMHSTLPKVLHKIAGKPILSHVIDNAKQLQPTAIHIVYGFGGELVPETIGNDFDYVFQSELLGSGHAVMQALPYCKEDSKILILVSDIPLISSTTLAKLIDSLDSSDVAVLTAVHTPLFCGEDRSLDFFLKELKLFCRAGAVDFLTEV